MEKTLITALLCTLDTCRCYAISRFIESLTSTETDKFVNCRSINHYLADIEGNYQFGDQGFEDESETIRQMPTNQSISDNERDYKDGKIVLQMINDVLAYQFHRPDINESKGEKEKTSDQSMSEKESELKDGNIHQRCKNTSTNQLHSTEKNESEIGKVKTNDDSVLKNKREHKDGDIHQMNNATRSDQLHRPDKESEGETDLRSGKELRKREDLSTAEIRSSRKDLRPRKERRKREDLSTAEIRPNRKGAFSIRAIASSQPEGDPDPSGSSSDSESDEDSKGDFYNSRGKQHTRKKAHNSRCWRECLNEVNKEKVRNDAQDLIATGVWPTGKILKKAYKKVRQNQLSLDTFRFICENLCTHLKTKSNKIKSVWAGHRRKQVVLVILTEHDNDICPNMDEYSKILEYRGINTYSDEGKYMTFCEENSYNPTPEDTTIIRECLQNNTKSLMKTHSNITIISSDYVRSKNYKKDAQRVLGPCIVLYVHIKGVIPIGEVEFPKYLDGIPTDVREGGFTWCGSTAEEFQQSLKMGSQISGVHSIGTIGPILEYNDGRQFFFTSAHVLLTAKQFKDLSSSEGYVEYDNNTNHRQVFQPQIHQHDDTLFGQLHAALYRKGGHDQPGIEIAIVEINRRHPENGTFPDFCIADVAVPISNPLIYTNGQTINNMVELSHLIMSDECTVLKIGSQTGITSGKLGMQGMAVKQEFLNMEIKTETQTPLKIELHNQIGIKSKVPFAQIGDSGALTFLHHRAKTSNELRPFGIFEGFTTFGVYIVTPIWDILESLPQYKLRKFEYLPCLLKEIHTLTDRYRSQT